MEHAVTGAPVPTAEGDLEDTPFAHLLVYALRHRLTGTLAIWPEPNEEGEPVRGQDRIYFHDGSPVAGRLLASASALDRALLPLFHRSKGPYAFYEQNLVGDAPNVLQGRVEPLMLLTASVRGGAREAVVNHILDGLGNTKLRLRADVDLRRFSLDAKEQAFIELLQAAPATTTELVSSFGDARLAQRLLYVLAITRAIEAYVPAAEGEGATPPPRSTSSMSTPVTAAAPAASPVPPATSSAFVPAPAAATAAEELPLPSFDSLPPVQSSSVSPSGRSTSVRPSTAPRPQSGAPRASWRTHRSPPPPPPLPPGLPPEVEERWREIVDRAATIEQQNYFEMLGVDRSASTETVRDAYFAVVKKWHPDRLPAQLADLHPWADRIFHYMTLAKDTLSDDTKRTGYMRAIQDGGGTPTADRRLEAVVQAAMEFQKVEILARRRDFKGAFDLLSSILELNPDEADYHAMYAFLRFQMQGGKGPTPNDVLTSVDRALALNPKNERAHYTKGLVLKHLGKHADALTHFRTASDLNPKNIDAVREVRIATMRDQRTPSTPSAAPGDPKSSGLLSKIFGGGKKKG